MNLMQQYVNEQPEVLKAIINDRKQIVGSFVNTFEKSEIERVVIIGSGSSYNAGLMAKPLIEKSMGVEVNVIVPTRMNDLKYIHSTKVLYCVLSQGGRSTNTLQVIRELKTSNKPVIAVTEMSDSPIAQLAGLTLTIPIGEENIGAKTKGVTSTALVLMLAFLDLGLRRGSIEDSFYRTTIQAAQFITDHMDENIKRALTWCKLNNPKLSEIKTLNIIAKGNNNGPAMEGRLKLLETIWKPVSCFEFEEYLHGPENAMDEMTCGLLLVPNDEDARRMVNLANYAESKGSHFLLIDLKNNPTETRQLSLIGSSNDFLTCFEFLLPMQTLSAQLSAYMSNDLTKPRFPDFYTLMGTKLQ